MERAKKAYKVFGKQLIGEVCKKLMYFVAIVSILIFVKNNKYYGKESSKNDNEKSFSKSSS